ncbi:MAG: hypothetical protein JSW54_10855, partial [Fidelibacterota bacterium]
ETVLPGVVFTEEDEVEVEAADQVEHPSAGETEEKESFEPGTPDVAETDLESPTATVMDDRAEEAEPLGGWPIIGRPEEAPTEKTFPDPFVSEGPQDMDTLAQPRGELPSEEQHEMESGLSIATAREDEKGEEYFTPGEDAALDEEPRPEQIKADTEGMREDGVSEVPHQHEATDSHGKIEPEQDIADLMTADTETIEAETVPADTSQPFEEGNHLGSEGIGVDEIETRDEDFVPGAPSLHRGEALIEDRLADTAEKIDEQESDSFEPGAPLFIDEDALSAETDYEPETSDSEETADIPKTRETPLPADESREEVGESGDVTAASSEEEEALFEPGTPIEGEPETIAGEMETRPAEEGEETGAVHLEEADVLQMDAYRDRELTEAEAEITEEAGKEAYDAGEPGDEVTAGGESGIPDEITAKGLEGEDDLFEPGAESTSAQEEAVQEIDDLSRVSVEDKEKQEEPYQPDRTAIHEDIKTAEEIARSAAVASRAFEAAEVEPEHLRFAESEAGLKDESRDADVAMDERDRDEEELFEPGLPSPDEGAGHTIEAAAAVEEPEAGEAESVEPETTFAQDMDEAIDEDLEPEAAELHLPTSEPGDLPVEEPQGGPEDKDFDTIILKDKERDEAQFEPGTPAKEEPEAESIEAAPGYETREGKDTEEAQAWHTDIQAPVAEQESATLDKIILEEKDSPEGQDAAIEPSADEERISAKESLNTVKAEDKDLEREPFEPGDEDSEEATAELDQEALRTQDAAESERKEEPYQPDVVSLDKEAKDEQHVVDKAVHGMEEVAGEKFEPSTAAWKEETQPEPEEEEQDQATEAVSLDEESTEEDADDDKLRIDPKLATFTLATIYKVQGLHQQALQVLDMLEAKGSDPERIAAEREAIIRQMTGGS